jgi:hypothetical protein
MRLLKKLFRGIKRFVPQAPLSDKEALLAELNPDKIYIENVRSILNVSHETARRICETAVRQGEFLRGIEVMCPSGAVAAMADTEDKLPKVVRCWMEDSSGHSEEVELPTSTLRKTIFYRLNDKTDSIPFGQTA